MKVFEILLIAVALSMDAFSVCVSAGIVYTGITKKQSLTMPVAFGVFQSTMPIVGFFLGSMFEQIITRWQGVVSLAILGVIGLNMIIESVFKKDSESNKELSFFSLIALSVATSIDAFAVGVSFVAMGISGVFDMSLDNIFSASLVIGITTFILCIFALIIGKKLGDKLGDKAEIAGGIVLILIGLKNFLF